MRNIKLTLQYIGTHYHGWQIQPNGPTIQSILQDLLAQTLQEKIVVLSAGRTDSGVHALGQVAHFKTKNPMDINKLQKALNSQLPKDISVLSTSEVGEDFNAMTQALSKTYCYFILNSQKKIPFLIPFTWRKYGRLNLEEIQKCLELIVGEHDFSAFKASDSTARTAVRKIDVAQLNRIPLGDLGQNLLGILGLGALVSREASEEESEGALLSLSFKGKGFLKHMVRNLVGTLVDVGRGKLNSEDFKRIMESRDRRQAGVTAPPQGLFLVKVEYPPR